MAEITYTTMYTGYWRTTFRDGVDFTGMRTAHEILTTRCNALNMTIKNISMVNDSFWSGAGTTSIVHGSTITGGVGFALPIGFIAFVEAVIDIEEMSKAEFSELLAKHGTWVRDRAFSHSAAKYYEDNKQSWDRLCTAKAHEIKGMLGTKRLAFEDVEGKEFTLPFACIGPELIPGYPETLAQAIEAIETAKKIKSLCENKPQSASCFENALAALSPDIAARLFAILEDPKDIDCR